MSRTLGCLQRCRYSGLLTPDSAIAMGVKHVQFKGVDGVMASIPIEKALSPYGDVLVAYEMNGEPLPPEHGGPLRIIVRVLFASSTLAWSLPVLLWHVALRQQWACSSSLQLRTSAYFLLLRPTPIRPRKFDPVYFRTVGQIDNPRPKCSLPVATAHHTGGFTRSIGASNEHLAL
jgi:hypothetical protein